MPYLRRAAPRTTVRAMGISQDPTSVAARFRAALELMETGMALQRQNIRRRHPDASEAEIDRLFDEWLLERPLDGPGRRVDWPRRRP